ncbi:MAG TPA: S1C family serine protease [Terriglobales bacterium]|nr:S1C family serine protease [Terriglobales bacterium]
MSVLSDLSQELAAAVEKAGPSVVTVHARHRVPSSGIFWRQGLIVTADHTVRREEDLSIAAQDGKRISAKLAGRDPGTDLAILKVEEGGPAPQFGDPAGLKLGHFVLALGRTRYAGLVASAGIIGGLGGEYRTWRGGKVDQNIRLGLELYPGFSGGPLVSVEGKVLGVNTNGLGRGRAVTIPVSTVNRTVDALLERGYIPRPYLGVAMQPVSLPEAVRGKLKSAPQGGLMVLHVEPSGPAEKAGIVLGDVIVELQAKPALDMANIRDLLASSKIGDTVKATVVRAGVPVEVTLTLGERPAK